MRKLKIKEIAEDAHDRITAINVLLHNYKAEQNNQIKEVKEEIAKLIKRLEGQGLLVADIRRVNFDRPK